MPQIIDSLDLGRLDFWAKHPDERLDYFKYLRREKPVSWHGSPAPGTGRGFWAIARYDDVRSVSRDPTTWSSASGVANFLPEVFTVEDGGPVDPMEAALGAQSFLVKDDPEHRRMRGLVQQAFSARQIARIEADIARDARTIVAELEAYERGDFVTRVAKRLPLITISRMLGVSDDERDHLLDLVDGAVSFSDPDFLDGRNPMDLLTECFTGIATYAYESAQYARRHPDSGLMSALVDAELDGERLTDAEIAQFFLLLAVAGNDTTRNTTSHAMRALTRFPTQRTILMEDLAPRLEVGVDEFLRWATPVTNFMRTATRATEVAGQPIAPGQKIMMLYSSANRDESVFEEPERFDVTRTPNRHVTFGGGGPHFCLGAPLARTQLRTLFAELLMHFPELEVDEPRYLVSNFMNAPQSMAMDTGRRAR